MRLLALLGEGVLRMLRYSTSSSTRRKLYKMRLLTLLPLLGLAAAHVNHDVEKEMAERREFMLHSRSNLNHCADKIAERGLEKRAAKRRAELATKLAKRNGIEGRDTLPDLRDLVLTCYRTGSHGAPWCRSPRG